MADHHHHDEEAGDLTDEFLDDTRKNIDEMFEFARKNGDDHASLAVLSFAEPDRGALPRQNEPICSTAMVHGMSVVKIAALMLSYADQNPDNPWSKAINFIIDNAGDIAPQLGKHKHFGSDGFNGLWDPEEED